MAKTGSETPKVYTLVVQVGRSPGDGLPEGASGAGLLCYAAARDEAEAVRETVAILREAGMAPLDVTGHGTLAERLAEGQEIAPEEKSLMDRAVAEDAVIVAEVTPFFDDADDADDADGADGDDGDDGADGKG
ncbi:MAG: hypothetical protein GVY28_08100 [Alphaproteobacteria bacterium]|jgi:hypothetical protein|nr:hypothetical protein [Alphaproteobacteria bacterium]